MRKNKMHFDMEKFLKDQNISICPTNNRHYRPEWINVHCPLCVGSIDYHMGWHKYDNYFNCWRCDFHTFYEVIPKLIQVSESEAKRICRPYWKIGGRKNLGIPIKQNRAAKLQLPQDCGELLDMHRRYLERRNFNPDHLVKTWKIMGTGLLGQHSHRIVIPIFYQNHLISFTTRAVLRNADSRYISCKEENEVIPHKNVLYGIDHCINHKLKRVVLVEGCFDVWRLGIGAVATFGTKFTEKQLELLEQFETVNILFDPEMEAQKSAKKIKAELEIMNTEVKIIKVNTTKDPAKFSQKFANRIMKKYVLKI